MSVNGIAFWSSDYAYEIMGTKRISYSSFDISRETGEKPVEEEEFVGFKPRVDKYIPLFQKREIPEDEKIKFLGEKDENTEENGEIKFANEKDENTQNPKNIEKNNENIQKTEQYSEEEKKVIDELRSRDAEVRNHEQSHISAGGAYIRGGASYTYQSGPDGKQYAIGGEVSIDTSPVKGNPEATIAKMQTVISAAMAPANPSGADRAVAAAASQIQMSALAEVLEKNGTENSQNSEDSQKTEQNSEFSTKSENPQKTERNNDENIEFSAASKNSQISQNNDAKNIDAAADSAIKAQNDIVSAISAYTAGVQKLASKIDFTA